MNHWGLYLTSPTVPELTGFPVPDDQESLGIDADVGHRISYAEVDSVESVAAHEIGEIQKQHFIFGFFIKLT